MNKHQQVAALFLKNAPPAAQKAIAATLQQAQLEALSPQQLDPMLRYFESLEKHREYLDFFQIGVYRDQKSKIQQVAKYVGLAIRPVEIFPDLNAMSEDPTERKL